MCMLYVFGALLEFTLVNYYSREDGERKQFLKSLKNVFSKKVSNFLYFYDIDFAVSITLFFFNIYQQENILKIKK